MTVVLLDPKTLGVLSVIVTVLAMIGAIALAERFANVIFAALGFLIAASTLAIKQATQLAAMVSLVAVVAIVMGVRHIRDGLTPTSKLMSARYPWLAAAGYIAPGALGIQYFWNNGGPEWTAQFGNGVWVTTALLAVALAVAVGEAPRRWYRHWHQRQQLSA
jgi:hypothetical protein